MRAPWSQCQPRSRVCRRRCSHSSCSMPNFPPSSSRSAVVSTSGKSGGEAPPRLRSTTGSPNRRAKPTCPAWSSRLVAAIRAAVLRWKVVFFRGQCARRPVSPPCPRSLPRLSPRPALRHARSADHPDRLRSADRRVRSSQGTRRTSLSTDPAPPRAPGSPAVTQPDPPPGEVGPPPTAGRAKPPVQNPRSARTGLHAVRRTRSQPRPATTRPAKLNRPQLPDTHSPLWVRPVRYVRASAQSGGGPGRRACTSPPSCAPPVRGPRRGPAPGRRGPAGHCAPTARRVRRPWL